MVGPLHSQEVQIAQEVFHLAVSVGGEVHAFSDGALDGSAVHVRDEHHLDGVEILGFKEAGQEVRQEETPRLLDGEVPVEGRAP